MCCEAADEEQLRYEPELFNCTTCPVAAARASVWPENLDAWHVFQRLAARVVVETHVGAEVFRRLTEERGPDDVDDLVERLSVIYEWLVPPPRE